MSNEPDLTVVPEAPEPSPGDEHGHPGPEPHPTPHPVETTIIVNGQKKVVQGDTLSYEQAVDLAYNGNPPSGYDFTVGYRNGPREQPEGSLTAGHSVKIVNDEIFNVTDTHKS